MNHRTDFSPASTMLTIELDPEESIHADVSAIVVRSGATVTAAAAPANGLLGGIRRMLATDAHFPNRLEGGPDGGWVTLAPRTPGDINSAELSPLDQPIFIQTSCLLAHTPEILIDTKFQGFKSLFSSDDLYFVHASAPELPGIIWYSSFGAIAEVPIDPDHVLSVETTHLIAFTGDVQYRAARASGPSALLPDRESAATTTTTLEGQGTAWVQARSPAAFNAALNPAKK